MVSFVVTKHRVVWFVVTKHRVVWIVVTKHRVVWFVVTKHRVVSFVVTKHRVVWFVVTKHSVVWLYFCLLHVMTVFSFWGGDGVGVWEQVEIVRRSKQPPYRTRERKENWRGEK